MSKEAFERIHCGGIARITRRNEHGDYVSPAIQDAWAGWQAARAAALEEAAAACERVELHCGDHLKNSDPRATCAEAIRALKDKE